MKKLFIETSAFTKAVKNLLDDETYAAFQRDLIADPNRGDVMSGCGGLRKIRLIDPKRRKGKRGGIRIVYLHAPEANWILLVDIYGKEHKTDLSSDEKKILRQLAEEFKKEAARKSSLKVKNRDD